jgi:glutathione S-transferase
MVFIGITKKKIESFLPYIDQSLVGKSFLTGYQFTVADIYLFTVLGWTQWFEVSTKEFKNITAYMKRIFDRPAVYKILAEEDLLDYLQ